MAARGRAQASKTPAWNGRAGEAAGRAAAAPVGARSFPDLLWLPWLPLLLLLTVVAVTAFARPLIGPLDAPALAAAWECLSSDDWLLWRAGGGAAAELPPLLPWAIAAGWSVFGTGAAWPWLLTAAALAGSLLLTRALAARLWPQRADAAALASWAFAGCAGVVLAGIAIRPEAAAILPAAAGLIALARAAEGRPLAWTLFALSASAMGLTAGIPASAVLLGPALLAPCWAASGSGRGWLRWYLALALAAAFAAAPALLLSAASRPELGGPAWMGTLRPGLLPLLSLPLFFYPWPFWPRTWRSARRQSGLRQDAGVRLCLIAAASGLLAAVLAGAGAGGLLPAAPAGTALIARLLAGRLPGRADFHAGIPALPLALLGAASIAITTVPWAQLAGRAQELAGIELPIWIAELSVGGAMIVLAGTFLLIQGTPRRMLSRVAQLALLPAILAAAVAWEMSGSLGRSFDPAPLAARIAELQSRDVPVALYDLDPSAYVFAGRLEKPLAALSDAEGALAWARAHPEGAVLAPFRGSVLHLPRQPSYAAAQGPIWVALWPAAELSAAGAAVLEPRP